MIGHNKMKVNTATLIEMVQHYFETVLFATTEVPTVTTLVKTSESYEDWFEIGITSPDKKE